MDIMQHRLIKSIETRILKGRQFVIVGFHDNEFVFMAANNIKQNTTLHINEIELLIGSTLRVDFYKEGEMMFNGKTCIKENTLVKEYFFSLQKPVEILKTENKNQLLPYEKIAKIFYSHKFNKENVGIETGNGKVIFVHLKRFEVQSQLKKSEQHILIGSYIMPEYYKKGEAFSDGTVVQNDNALKWLNIRYSGKVEEMHKDFEERPTYYRPQSSQRDASSGPNAYGYSSWDDMILNEVFEGNSSNYWNVD